ncbi:MAG: MFS transporter [Dermatophilaceae bacterium]
MTITSPEPVAYGSPTGRAVIAAATLGSGMTLLDGSVVNIALKTIGTDLGADLAALQWIMNGYLLSLASFILLGGALGDRFGRRRIFVIGTIWFALASLLCALAWSPGILIVARVLQGAGGALLTPGSLAMIQGVFASADRARAIGAWSGLGGVAAAIGPFVGGALIEVASWRWIFIINLPLALGTVIIARRFVPETRDPQAPHQFDVVGAATVAIALAGITYALIQWGDRLAPVAAVVGVVSFSAFLVIERRSTHPMMPLPMFGSRQFSAANGMTLLVYAALGAITFFLVLQLQTVAGWSPLLAGVALLPITACMLLFAARGGALAQRIGPRLPMTLGPIIMAAGTLMLIGAGPDTNYVRDVLPGLTVFGLGLALMVAPLTATVLAAAPDEHAGIASGINNAVARAGSLLAVAALPVAVGLSGEAYAEPIAMNAGYQSAVIVCAGLLFLGGVLSWLLIRNPEVPLEPGPIDHRVTC